MSDAGRPARGALMRVLPLPGWRDPVEALRLFAGEPMPALLHSGATSSVRHDAGRWSFLCAAPFRVVSWSAGQPGDPFRMLEQAVGGLRCRAGSGSPFTGGAVGFIGYEAARAIEAIRPSPSRRRAGRDPALPDLLFGLYSWTVAWDHLERTWAILSTGLPESGRAREEKARADAEAIKARLERLSDDGAVTREAPSRASQRGRATILGSTVPREGYLRMVEQARSLIAAGELYQVNLSQRLEFAAPADAVALFASVARHSPAPFSAFLDTGSCQIVSASPERFVSLRGRRAESRPIKGTRPRGATRDRDEALRRDLLASPKDRAENVMIVDLVRNDLGRVCRPGSVTATEVCRAEAYASVHHLVSIVSGELEEGRDRADLLRALFPGGSMTGAPKVRAMQAIEDLEPVARGIYAGAVGYLSFCGAMDLSIVIRTAVVSGERAWLQVGGGIVADSEPEAEYRETLDKAESVLRAIEATASA